MIEIKTVSKSFEGKVIFSNLELKIDSGEFVIFSGASGCGKTTLLNMIGAIESIDSGEILVDGLNIHKRKYQLQYFKYKIGLLFQNFALVEHKTVKENLKLVRKESQSGVSIEQALEMVGISDKLNSKVYTLSGGEQQRVALARLMVKKCNIILADEPTGSLDKKNAEAVLDIIKQLHNQGKTIIMVTHDEDMKKKGERIINL
ncbi:bacteriocin ABC transporter ATP-binding protein [Paenibacillus marchantiophytorum]|uniref:Bacteriocin ABC transporter ATP-binding protein n=1 Tax=Paenibacillus marchantiophytorum TaxID=1619310 RepID=A0ABQ1FL86_9BACL|nr:ABC transporter ATP-binding protein [Paenibacillus marchantiophytorum]GGA18402.1 bacteriocin ABC transporter ATP-binding protein [Paenibacillus marchantiophytorum]